MKDLTTVILELVPGDKVWVYSQLNSRITPGPHLMLFLGLGKIRIK